MRFAYPIVALFACSEEPTLTKAPVQVAPEVIESRPMAIATIPASVAMGRRDGRSEIAFTDDVALALARVCVSESGWDSPTDCEAIWQVTLNVRSRSCDGARYDPLATITECRLPDGSIREIGRGEALEGAETPLSALRRLSRRVTGLGPPLFARQRWTSTLDPEGAAPAGWDECREGEGRCDGRWSDYRDRWLDRLAQARMLVTRPRRPCPGPVLAWGCDLDHEIAKRRGLETIDCGETRNTFWRRPADG